MFLRFEEFDKDANVRRNVLVNTAHIVTAREITLTLATGKTQPCVQIFLRDAHSWQVRDVAKVAVLDAILAAGENHD